MDGRPDQLHELNRRLEEMIEQRIDELREKSEELERHNEELARANATIREADRLKSEFLANISHELRTPMNSILGFTNMLLRGSYGYLNENQRQNLKKVYANAQHLMHIIDDLLNLSHLELGKVVLRPKSLSVKNIVLSSLVSVEPLMAERTLRMEHRIPPDIPNVYADQVRVREVLINLLSNAIKFTPDHGRIVIDAALVHPERGGQERRPMVKLRVRDTGVGIRREDQRIIFDQFRQLNTATPSGSRGSGLGLFITRKLVKRLGGTIEVKSQVGKGSSFAFTLPVAGQENEDPQGAAPEGH
ncbi:MAG: ATP-binding protein [bacterium]|nr:ATP-binding protein [bacterium]